VRLHPDANVDLALLQIDDAGKYPAVHGIESTVDVNEGETIATLGFPLGTDTPMEGDIVKTSLTAGRVSKLLPDVLQIDAYASHGSSGSPVLDQHGRVVGVIYGGAKEAEGRIVYAVPASKIEEILKSR
jgi:S1-C subfamily serine protease